MQRLIILLSATLVFVCNALFAQNCPSSPTYKNASASYNLTSAGSSYAANDGKTYSLTVTNGLSATSTICVTNGSTLNLSFSNVTNPVAGATIYVDATSKLNLSGSDITRFPFTINNYGTLNQNIHVTYENGAVINNYGTYTTNMDIIVNTGTVTMSNNNTMNLLGSVTINSQAFTLNNQANGVLTFKNTVVFNTTNGINNKGTINFNGVVTFNTVDINNSGYAYFNKGTVTINNGSLINYGLVDAKEDIVNNGSTITNYCTITTDKNFTHNTSILTNYGSILLPTNTASSFIVQGNFVNGPNGFVQGYDFTNNNSITGGGNFYFQHTTINSGTFSGSATSNINFYDATGNPGNGNNKIFDTQNTTPSFTTKNKISPVATTSLVACGAPAAPAITTQPLNVTLCDNSITTATFNVIASSPYSSMTYQWKKNGVNITGATSSSYTATNLTLADTANAYTVAITNSNGTTISNSAFVDYIIVAQPAPASLYIATGSTANFTIKTSGATAWQWQKNGAKVASATAPAYSIAAAKTGDAGSYNALVTYDGGTCLSDVSTLKVEDLPTISKQPVAQQILCSGTTSVSFSVTATSTSAMSYQWYKGTNAITGATAATYTANGLTLADTANVYTVKITNGVGAVTSSVAGFKYAIVTQPTSQTVLMGSSVTFAPVVSSVVTSYKWQKDGKDLKGGNTRTYTISSVDTTDAGNYWLIANYAGGNCTSNAATLTIIAPPVVTAQPQTVQLCNTTYTSATFGVAAASPLAAITYQWYKNGTPITGATSSSYTATGLGYADTANMYTVKLTNIAGTTTSNAVHVQYIIVAQPKTTTVVTGNPATFTIKLSGASAVQWYKSGSSINKETALSYTIPVVNTTDSTSYTALVTYSGGTCLSSAVKLIPATIVYSKATGSLNAPATWGSSSNGTGSTPLDFTRDEHTFVIANRDTLTNTADLTIAGTLDLKDGKLILAPNTTLTAGRIVRSGNTGVIAGTSTSSIKLTGISTAAYTGASDLFFDAKNNTIKALYTAGHTVNLRSALNLTAGTIAGILQVNSGTFNTFDSLTLKSDSLGTAFVYQSKGVINGKVTVEKYFSARRAYRFICSPVAANGAPTINAAWQEGATSSTDNPRPGYGTHITYGAVADGYDQNPQKSYSMYVLRNGSWYGVPAPKTTKVTDYPAYMTFIRGDRSYDITTTTNTTTPKSTILRTTGNLNQGAQPAITVSATGYTLVANPFASPIDFDVVVKNSDNIKKTARIWDPKLAGTKGVGAYVTVDWTSTGYITTPPSDVKNIIPAGQGFWVQSNNGNKTGTLNFDEVDKYLPDVYSKSYNTFRQATNREAQQEAMLEVDLKVFNEDSTTGIADGVLYHFSDDYNNDVDNDDIAKMKNVNENLSISNNNTLLTVERRKAPLATDTLQLNFTGSKTGNYLLEFVPKSFSNITVGNLFLYDRYLKTRTPLSNTDTTRVTISINTADALSKDANRFSIVGQQQVVLPVTFSSVKAYAKAKTAQVEWTVGTEIDVQRYEVEKSANGTTFTKAGEVNATGATSYSFNDAAPFSGNSYYRVKSVDKSGKVTYSKILPVTINNSNTAVNSLSVYPNPITGKTFQIQLNNKAAGTYTLYLVSNNGQQLFTQTVTYNGGSAVYNVQLKNNLASGLYFIKAVAADGKQDVLKVIVQ